ncbi:MAG: flagellar basal body rod protein FlgB [Lachnospiraceae bacterium]|nr:flagellar basal body rod protein FlgB [Lachnospiraceae bacterium]
MIKSDVYNYINVLDKAADASWLRNEAISNNIANVDTPNYKRQDVTFESELKHALGAMKFRTLDDKVEALNRTERLSQIEPRTYIDHAAFSYRLDGNNVDIDTENVELASNEIKYNALIQSIDQEFKNLKSVMK